MLACTCTHSDTWAWYTHADRLLPQWTDLPTRPATSLLAQPDPPAPLSDWDGSDAEHSPAGRLLRDPATYAAVESELVLVGLTGLQVRGRWGAQRWLEKWAVMPRGL